MIAAGSLHVFDLDRFFAAQDNAEQALGDAEPRLVEISLAGAAARAQVEPFATVVEQEHGGHFARHQLAGLARDDFERVIEVKRGVDGLADVDQRLEQTGFEAQLFVEPGVVNDLGGLQREFLQKLLVFGAERVEPVGIDVKHPANLAADFERDGEFGPDIGLHHNVTRIFRHVADAGRFARARDPAGNSFAESESELQRVRRQAVRHVDFEKASGRIEQRDRAAGGAHQAHRLAENQFERFAGFERGVNDVADLIKQAEPFVAGSQFGQFVAHAVS